MEGGATPEKHEAHSTQLSTNMLFPCLLAEFSSKRWEFVFVYTFGQSNHQSAADLDVIHTTHTHTHAGSAETLHAGFGSLHLMQEAVKLRQRQL